MASVGVIPIESRTFSVAALVAESILAWTTDVCGIHLMYHVSNTCQEVKLHANVQAQQKTRVPFAEAHGYVFFPIMGVSQ